MYRKSLLAIIALFCSLNSSIAQDTQELDQGRVLIAEVDSGFEVTIDGELFTRYVITDETKPMLFPLLGPGQVPMTRSFPMEEVEGEANDHPHHKSVWLGHEVNDHVDFWANKGGVIKNVGLTILNQSNDSLTVKTQWINSSDDSVVCHVLTTMQFDWDDSSRWIDFQHTFHATDGDLKFIDTKEGLFAIRSHPDLRLSPAPKRGVKEVFGKAINSEGDRDKELWGKSAKWVNYWGQVDGELVGFAIFDHPDNFRHPTHWHARDYGLVAANPFGLHHFTKAEKGTGEHTLPAGDSMKFQYRLLLHAGDHEAANIEERYEAFVK